MFPHVNSDDLIKCNVIATHLYFVLILLRRPMHSLLIVICKKNQGKISCSHCEERGGGG